MARAESPVRGPYRPSNYPCESSGAPDDRSRRGAFPGITQIVRPSPMRVRETILHLPGGRAAIPSQERQRGARTPPTVKQLDQETLWVASAPCAIRLECCLDEQSQSPPAPPSLVSFSS